MSNSKLKNIGTVVDTVHKLRAPGGCPWDGEQTHQSLRPYAIEEAYEVIETIDELPGADSPSDETPYLKFKEELGDLLMQVLIHSEIARESGKFDFYDVAETLNAKLIRRHPHVFGDPENRVDSAQAAYQNWEKQKALEKDKKAKDPSVLAGLPKALPSLQRATRMLEKVTRVGFQWPDLDGPLSKVTEEIDELKEAIATKDQTEISKELGDVLLTLCNLSLKLGINPEDSLRETLHRFENRFRHVETAITAQGKSLTESTLEEMDVYWNEAKAKERRS